MEDILLHGKIFEQFENRNNIFNFSCHMQGKIIILSKLLIYLLVVDIKILTFKSIFDQINMFSNLTFL